MGNNSFGVRRPGRRGLVAVGVGLAMLAAGCATSGEAIPAGSGSPSLISLTPTTPQPVVEPTPADDVWAPANAGPLVPLPSSGEQGVRINLGDRVLVPDTLNGKPARLDEWFGVLVPYGANNVYLAVKPGAAQLSSLGEAAPCGEPPAEGGYPVTVTDQGTAPQIPATITLTEANDGASIDLLPGQRVEDAQGRNIVRSLAEGPVVEGAPAPIAFFDKAAYGLRPGKLRVVVLEGARHAMDVVYEVSVTVHEPGTETGSDFANGKTPGPAGNCG